MAVAFNGQATAFTSVGTTVSFSYASGSGSNRGLLVGCTPATGTITSASYGGVGFGSALASSGSVYVFGQAAPLTGSNTMQFVLSNYTRVNYAAADFTDVNQATPYGTPVVATGSNMALDTGSVTVPANGMAFGFGYTGYSTATLTIVSGTLTGSSLGASGGDSFAGAYRATTGALAWAANRNNAWVAIGIPINAAGGGGGVKTPAALLNLLIGGYA